MKTAYSSQFGTIFLVYEEGILTGLLLRQEPYQITEEDLQSRTKFTDMVMDQVKEYLQGKRRNFEFKFKLIGTAFQRKVWEALLEIPYGETRSYKQIAEAIGNPKACRAIGMANNKNPIMIIVPCHRVIGSDGSLTGYAGGMEMKKNLLELEGAL